MSAFGARLGGHRARSGLSQNGLARLAGCDPAYVNRLEKGSQKAPARDVVLKLADALELDQIETDELLIAAGLCPSSIASLDDDRRRALLTLLAR